ncbi:MAG: hypothetical protein P8163_18635 [Candidatus Thiodiazotropha sp.]
MEENPYQPSTSTIKESREKSGIYTFFIRFLISLGVVFGIIILLFIFVGISTSNTYSKFKNNAEPFIESFLNSQNPWDYTIAKPLLSDPWLKTTTDEDGIKLFGFYNKLGSLKSIKSINWQGCSNYTGTSGSIERCDYHISSVYTNGNATIDIGLSIEGDTIKLLHLSINSNVFVQ